MSVPNINIVVHHQNLETGVKEVVRAVRTDWSSKDLIYKLFTDGLTNHLAGCYVDENEDDMVLVRVYGENSELYIDRQKEFRMMCLLHEAGCGPRVHCLFKNGICYDYMPGKRLDGVKAGTDTVANSIAKALAKYHTLRWPDDPVIRDEWKPEDVPGINIVKLWLDAAPDALNKVPQEYRSGIKIKSLAELRTEFENLVRHLSTLESPVVMGHNDLAPVNIIYNEQKGTTAFIDYEYSDYSYEACDIALLFIESSIVEWTDTPKMPDREFQMKWLKRFLEHKMALIGKPSSDVTEEAVEKLFFQVSHFSLFALMFGSVWSLAQFGRSESAFDSLR